MIPEGFKTVTVEVVPFLKREFPNDDVAKFVSQSTNIFFIGFGFWIV